jgi:hypothetical protein
MLVSEAADTSLTPKKNKLASCRIDDRPYISLSGPKISGPIAKTRVDIQSDVRLLKNAP